jgi:hypothetical protein
MDLEGQMVVVPLGVVFAGARSLRHEKETVARYKKYLEDFDIELT